MTGPDLDHEDVDDPDAEFGDSQFDPVDAADPYDMEYDR